MAVEGVLSDDSFGLVESPPLPEGLALFHALRSQFHVVLSTSQTEDSWVRRWLQYSAGIKPVEWARIMLADQPNWSEVEVFKRHMILCRAAAYDVRYVVTPSPQAAIAALRMGFTPLCCPHPVYSRTSFLPQAGEGGASWEQIENEVMAGRLARQNDDRLLIDDQIEEDQ